MAEAFHTTGDISPVVPFLADRQQRIVRAAQALSGRFGPIENETGDTIFSNDCDFQLIGPDLIPQLANTQDGVGIVIGAGGLLSLLPNLRIEAAIMIDRNAAVLDGNQHLANAITLADSSEEAINLVLPDRTEGSTYQRQHLANEAAAYGPYHWTSPRRFERVQQALQRIPLLFVQANIDHEKFGDALSDALAETQTDISFLNLTNVHRWVQASRMEPLLQSWPIRAQAPILFSTHMETPDNGYPRTEVAIGTKQYYQRTAIDL